MWYFWAWLGLSGLVMATIGFYVNAWCTKYPLKWRVKAFYTILTHIGTVIVAVSILALLSIIRSNVESRTTQKVETKVIETDINE